MVLVRNQEKAKGLLDARRRGELRLERCVPAQHRHARTERACVAKQEWLVAAGSTGSDRAKSERQCVSPRVRRRVSKSTGAGVGPIRGRANSQP